MSDKLKEDKMASKETSIPVVAKQSFGEVKVGDPGVLNIAKDSFVVNTEKDSLVYATINNFREHWGINKQGGLRSRTDRSKKN